MLTFEVTHGKSKTTITLSDDSTIGDLRSALEQWSKVPSSAQKISGPLGMKKDASSKLLDCGAKAGELVRAMTVEPSLYSIALLRSCHFHASSMLSVMLFC
jgi:hypothetical protein